MQLEMMTAEDQQLFWNAYYETWYADEYTEEDYLMDNSDALMNDYGWWD